jgi:hypothetical protein
MTSSFRFSCILAMISAVLVACPGKKHPEEHPNKNIRKIKGDPYIFVKGTAMNGNKPIPRDMLTEGSKWTILFNGFKEELQEQSSLDEVKKQQTPRDPKPADGGKDSNSFEVQMKGPHVVLSGKAFGSTFELRFRPADENSLILDEFISDGEKTAYDGSDGTTLLHTSSSEDRTAFSLLFHVTTTGERMVLAMIFKRQFTPSRVQSLNRTAGHFKFSFGEDVKVGWPKEKPLKLEVCLNGQPLRYAEFSENAVATWSRALGDKLKMISERNVACPPFSDLQTHTLTYLRDWIELESADDSVLGLTTSVADLENGRFIDSDVMFFLEEVQQALDKLKTGLDISSERAVRMKLPDTFYERTAIHEMGHVLGLHHQFDPDYPSIMSYDPNVRDIQMYDRRAVKALYE